MKKRTIALLVALLLLAAGLGTVQAAGKLSVVQESFYVKPYSDYHAGYLFAKIQNVGDKPVEFNGGLFELYDAEGNPIEANQWISSHPNVLGPGEVGYVQVNQSVKDAKEASFIDDYLLTITGKGLAENTTRYLQVENQRLELEKTSYSTYGTFKADIINRGDTVAEDFYVVFALMDKDGKLLYADYRNPSYVGIKPGNAIEMSFRMDSDFIKLFEEKGIQIDHVEAIAYIR